MTSNEAEWRNLVRLLAEVVGGAILFGIVIGATLGRHRG